MGIYDRDPVSCWHRGAVVLAGDAAAPIPPNLGQGGNKALEDAGVLVACLKRWAGTWDATCRSADRTWDKRHGSL